MQFPTTRYSVEHDEGFRRQPAAHVPGERRRRALWGTSVIAILAAAMNYHAIRLHPSFKPNGDGQFRGQRAAAGGRSAFRGPVHQ